MKRSFLATLATFTLLLATVIGQYSNTLDEYINSYCSDQFTDEITIQSVEDCFDQAIGVNPIVARRCRSLTRSPLERKRNRCSVKPVPSSLYTSIRSQCFIKEASNTGDLRTVNEVRRVQSIMDSFNFLLIRGFMRSQTAKLEMCLQSAFALRHPMRSQGHLVSDEADGQFYGPTSRVRVRRQAYPPPYGGGYPPGPGYAPYPDPAYQQTPSYYTPYSDPYQPYSFGGYQRDYIWRSRRRQIDRDLRSLGYTR